MYPNDGYPFLDRTGHFPSCPISSSRLRTEQRDYPVASLNHRAASRFPLLAEGLLDGHVRERKRRFCVAGLTDQIFLGPSVFDRKADEHAIVACGSEEETRPPTIADGPPCNCFSKSDFSFLEARP